MNNLAQFFKLKRRLERKASDLNLCLRVNPIDYDMAMTQLEDGKTYHYPEALQVNFENKSTGKYSYRLADGRFIHEGSSLSGKGLSIAQVYRRQLTELNQWSKQVKKGA